MWEDRYEAQRWSIEAGKEKRALYGDAARPMTDVEREIIESEPTLDSDGLVYLASVYLELCSCRGAGGYIPVTEMQRWCVFRGVARATALRMIQVLLRVDAVYLRQKRAKPSESSDNA